MNAAVRKKGKSKSGVAEQTDVFDRAGILAIHRFVPPARQLILVVRAKTVHVTFRLMICVVVLALCGCPLGTPRDHYTPDYEVAPSFSPDGQRIVYAAGVPGDRADHIFILGIDGNSKTQLTRKDANDTSPRFSPDGKIIVFARDKTYNWGGLAANWEPGGVICVIGTDGTGERQLTSDEVFAFAPEFSQDGKSMIYFTTDGCFSVPLDGSQPPRQIGPLVRYANLSPDGKQVVYAYGKYSPDYELFIANLDGTGKSQITASGNGCFHPVFARSGDRVYFLMEEWPQGPSGQPKSSIWTVKTNGMQQRQTTDLSLFDAPNDWKPQLPP